MHEKILYADDEPHYRKLVKFFLEKAGYKVLVCEDGHALLRIYSENPDADLVILDIMMPGMDGRKTCSMIREFSGIPVLMLTALGDVNNEISGINSGADDYLAKPFSNELLAARVKALLRRSRMLAESAYTEEGFEFDPKSALLKIEGREISLTRRERSLLEYLLLNKNQVLGRQQLLQRVWGYWYDGDPRTLDTHIKSLRGKLGTRKSYITTVRGSGYCFRGKHK